MKKNSGITLLALIITIIIMLILAGVTISIVGGSDGIIAKAEKAVSETDKAAMQEDAELAIAAIKMEYYEDYSVNKYKTAKQFIVEELQKSPYETSRGARMQADDAGNVTYTYKSVATRLMLADNGSVTLGESSDSGDDDVPITPAVQYTVTYNANGGTGVPTDSKDYSTGSTITVLFNTVPTREGYTFLGWATNANATEAEYTSSEIKTFAMETANVTLYAVWEKVDYSYLFNFDATTGTILGIKEEYYGDTPNVDYYQCEGKYSKDYNYANGYGGCVLTEAIDTLIVPSEIDGVAVKTIRHINVLNIRKLIIEDGIETIRNIANCNYTEDVDGLSEKITLEEVVIPDTVTTIENSTFYGCTTLTNINIPDSVTSIGQYAFSGCTSLSGINIPESVTSIGDYAFSGCTSLSSINIPESVTSIGNNAFYNCTSLSSVNMLNVESIGKSAFNNCTSLSSIEMPKVTTIGENAFNNCTSLNSIEMPNVTSIGNQAFSGSTNLSSVEMPNVTSIGGNAFLKCTSLSSVEMPNVESIGGSAFNDTAWYNNQSDGVVYAGKVLYKYKGAMPSNTSITINEGTKSITYEAFYNYIGLTSIKIPDTVTSIGVRTFYGCKNLTSIDIPSSVTSIGEYAFFGWTESQTINCEATSKPSGWAAKWDYYGLKVARKAVLNWGVSM